jgi:hypothetical protein
MSFENFFKHPWVTGEFIIENLDKIDLKGPLAVCVEQNNINEEKYHNRI